jgi:methyl-accepting chemotaxis protein
MCRYLFSSPYFPVPNEEQSAAGDNISRNIDSVATISASTATDIEHARNAMMSLSDISRALFASVAQFKLARVI